MTEQEAFDRVWGWFVTQGHEKSVNAHGCCAYRGPGGRKCAVGVLIPDDKYEPKMDSINSSGFQEMVLFDVLLAAGLGDDERFVELCAAMQVAHDGWLSHPICGPFRDHMRARLQKIAEDYGLQVPA